MNGFFYIALFVLCGLICGVQSTHLRHRNSKLYKGDPKYDPEMLKLAKELEAKQIRDRAHRRVSSRLATANSEKIEQERNNLRIKKLDREASKVTAFDEFEPHRLNFLNSAPSYEMRDVKFAEAKAQYGDVEDVKFAHKRSTKLKTANAQNMSKRPRLTFTPLPEYFGKEKTVELLSQEQLEQLRISHRAIAHGKYQPAPTKRKLASDKRKEQQEFDAIKKRAYDYNPQLKHMPLHLPPIVPKSAKTTKRTSDKNVKKDEAKVIRSRRG
eukprot:Platyproteum_vivax@DN12116_c0_g1_i1.p1